MFAPLLITGALESKECVAFPKDWWKSIGTPLKVYKKGIVLQ